MCQLPFFSGRRPSSARFAGREPTTNSLQRVGNSLRSSGRSTTTTNCSRLFFYVFFPGYLPLIIEKYTIFQKFNCYFQFVFYDRQFSACESCSEKELDVYQCVCLLLVYKLMISSGLPRDVLSNIWSTVNRTLPGELTRPEFFSCLALIALAQVNTYSKPWVLQLLLTL